MHGMYTEVPNGVNASGSPQCAVPDDAEFPCHVQMKRRARQVSHRRDDIKRRLAHLLSQAHA